LRAPDREDVRDPGRRDPVLFFVDAERKPVCRVDLRRVELLRDAVFFCPRADREGVDLRDSVRPLRRLDSFPAAVSRATSLLKLLRWPRAVCS
jgi:hypothetical protein